ncbi:outer membrane lipoprotein carrier protein LolA [Agromyces sp. NPDC058484]|uniref:LolA family protein n=1 Tax=Agromyces sp. NPDC058484 TaxID=3346524 RepID=UPI0036464A5D
MRATAHNASRREILTWIAVAAVPLAIGTGFWLPMQANAAVDLPDLTPAELIEFAASSEVDALSGTVEQTSELGLPDLSGLTGAMGGSAGGDRTDGPGTDDADDDGRAEASATDLDDLISLATGTHTARVYLDGTNARLQVLDRLAERDVYVSPDGAWVYDSREQAATHVTVDRAALDALKSELEAEYGAQADAHADELRERLEAELGAPLPTPEQLLDEALAKLDESTAVSVGTDSRVAGREVYELVLEPRDADTLVGEVSIAIDGDTGVALAASVTARGAEEPSFGVAFTEVSFEAPDASVFAFIPPAGTTVTEHVVPVPTVAELERWKAEAESERPGEGDGERMPRPIVHGEGWSAVVELPTGAASAGEEGAGGEGADGAGGIGAEASHRQAQGDAAMLDTLTEPVDGGRILQTSLVTVLFTDDGRVLAGAVTADRLRGAAASGR